MRIGFETYGSRHPTDQGGVLRLDEGVVVGSLALSFLRHAEKGELPADTISADFTVADSTGSLWQTTSSFTSELFLRYMFDIPGERDEVSRVTGSGVDFNRTALLDGVRYSSDDRAYRKINIDGELLCFQFKYSVLTFDVFGAEDDDEEYPLLSTLVVRFRKNALTLSKTDQGEPLAPEELFYNVAPVHLLRHNTAKWSDDYHDYRDGPIPEPLFFRKIAGQAKAQQEVVAE